MPSGSGIASQVPSGAYTRSQASKMIGRSVDTLKRWHKTGLVIPSTSLQAGQLKVWLYTDSDIPKLIHASQTQRPGRKPKNATSQP